MKLTSPRPNTRVQRTRSSPSVLRSPLMRRPLGRAMACTAVARLAIVGPLTVMFLGVSGIPQTAAKFAGVVQVSSKYQPEELRSVDDLPSQIAASLQAHLQQRLGADFLSRLHLTSGQAIDLEKLYRVDPSTKTFKWQIFSYRLVFSFSVPDKGIRAYEAEIWLDRGGNVIREIDIPAIAGHPSKGSFVPLSRALEVASARGFEPTHAELAYRPAEDIIAYHLIKVDEASKFYYLDVDAHSGEFVREWSVQGVP